LITLVHTHLPALLHRYGSLGLFILLSLGIIGLPIPDETLLLISGFLSAQGHLSIVAVFIAAFCGSCIGISISYLFGRFIGHKALLRFGNYVGITETKLATAHDWFQKFGKYLLFFGYFIPGIRHLSGIIAGTAELDYPNFALFAYVGAITWSTIFICIGYFFFGELQHWIGTVF
jgi:membrane protein DedA with SNARE-associated domain